MNCPRCVKDEQLVAIERFGIEIDYCSECRGVWLDRGELNKIIDKSELMYSQKITKLDYIDEAIFNNAYRKVKDDFENKRNKSFLKELFGQHKKRQKFNDSKTNG